MGRAPRTGPSRLEADGGVGCRRRWRALRACGVVLKGAPQQVSAAVRRSTPPSTSAIASIRRATRASFVLLAAVRSSATVKSRRVIAIAWDIACLLLPASAAVSSDFPGLGNPPQSHSRRPLVLSPACDSARFRDRGLGARAEASRVATPLATAQVNRGRRQSICSLRWGTRTVAFRYARSWRSSIASRPTRGTPLPPPRSINLAPSETLAR